VKPPSAGEIARATRTLLDPSENIQERVQAATLLSNGEGEMVKSVLQQIAERSHESGEVLRAAGRGLAAIWLRRGGILEVSLANLTADAYLAFDACVAESAGPMNGLEPKGRGVGRRSPNTWEELDSTRATDCQLRAPSWNT
jgi:hypothetical protein